MDKKVLPVMVTTYEAFYNCLAKNVQVIYVCMELYMAYTEEIYQALAEHGYGIEGYPARRGVFYAKGEDISQCVISDPYGLF